MPYFIIKSGGFEMNIANLVIFSFLTAFPFKKAKRRNPSFEIHLPVNLRSIYWTSGDDTL